MKAEGDSGFPAQTLALGARRAPHRSQSCRAARAECRAWDNVSELASHTYLKTLRFPGSQGFSDWRS